MQCDGMAVENPSVNASRMREACFRVGTNTTLFSDWSSENLIPS